MPAHSYDVETAHNWRVDKNHSRFSQLHERGNAGIRKVVERLAEEHKVIQAYLEEFETRIGALMAWRFEVG